jgi:hypothetical protein
MSYKIQFVLCVALTLGMGTATTNGRAADPDKTFNAQYVIAGQKSVDKLSSLLESLQDDIVDELTVDKEKTLFRLADQTLSELELLNTKLEDKNPTREVIYKQFDRVDRNIAALAGAISELSPKRPALARMVERVRIQSDDLHFTLSAGDETKERKQQVLVRQAKSMRSAAKHFAVSAEYAILDRPGRAPFLDAAKKFAEQCESFEKSVEGSELELCKKEFSILTNCWEQVVNGFLKLSAKEDYHIARQGFRLDDYHRRIFELLKMSGKRPLFTMKL